MLNEYKLKAICDVVKYYAETTGNDCNTFLETLRLVSMEQVNSEEYAQWLVQECFKVLQKRGVSMADILTQRNMLEETVSVADNTSTKSLNVTDWYKEGIKYIQDELGSAWSKAKIWSVTAGLGDLVASYDSKVYLSAVDSNSIGYADKYTNATCFNLDFLTTNVSFVEALPVELRDALLCNDNIVILMQIPDRLVKAENTEVGTKMISDGFSICAADISIQFIYRLLLLKQQYNLNNLTVGIYSSNVPFQNRAMQAVYAEFMRYFDYKRGMCFTFSGAKPEGDIHSVYFTVWKSLNVKRSKLPEQSLILDVKEKDVGVIQTKGVTYLKSAEKIPNLEEWVQPHDVNTYKVVPLFNAYNSAKSTGTVGANSMGTFISKYIDTDGVNKCMILNGGSVSGIDITEENFYRVVAAFAVRRLAGIDVSSPLVKEHFMSPDVTIEGYKEWLACCIPLFLFDNENYVCSYRNFECVGTIYNINNSFCPISPNYLSGVATDKVLLEDLTNNPPTNDFILKVIKEARPYFDEVTTEFFNFCINVLCDTYFEDNRMTSGYSNWTNAWDASLTQIRLTNNSLLWPKGQADKYAYLLNKYKKAIEYGICKFGFSLNTALNSKTDLEVCICQ